MTPELSRRLAWAVQFFPATKTSDLLKFYSLLDTVNDFTDLPSELQQLILRIEKQFGTNPNT